MSTPIDAIEVNGFSGRMRRLHLGKSQTATASEASISVSYLCQIEKGDRVAMSPERFSRWVRALDLDDARVVMANPHRGRVAA